MSIFARRELQISQAMTVGCASLLMAAMIALSRITGFGRLVVTSTLYGRGPQTDAYIAAFNIPDTLAILISGGLLATGFVPVFTQFLATNQQDAARRTFRALLTLMLIGFGGISLFLLALTWTPFGTLLAPENIGAQNVALYLEILRILLFAQFLFVVGGVFSGTFNALRLFWLPALQPVFFNCGIILFGIWGRNSGIQSQAWGALFGAAVGTILVLAPAAWKSGLSLQPLWDLKDAGVRKVAASLLPIFLGLASGQIIALNLPRAFAKVMPVGSTSSLDYANRLMQVPLDLLASGAAVALFPTLARLFVDEKPDELRETFGKALARNLAWMLMAAAMTAALARPLVALLLEHGKFSRADGNVTALVLQCYALCLPALGAQQLLARGFYATNRNRAPIGAGLFAMALFLLLGAFAVRLPLPGGAGLALAAAVSTSVLSLLLYRSLRKQLGDWGDAHLRQIAFRGLICALLAGGIAFAVSSGAAHFLASWDTPQTLAPLKLGVRALVLILGGGFGLGFWLVLGKRIGVLGSKSE